MLKRICAVALLLSGVGFVLVGPAFAHHSASSEYDIQRTIKITGVMTKFDWINPHAVMHMDVKDAAGKTTNWDVSFAGLSKLRLAGMGRQTLVPGQTYTVVVNPAHKGKHLGLINTLTFPDGHVFRMGQDTIREGQ